ncbi:MAG TPA: PAS domain S-box protein [Spirochaetota bacterium]|nr:PAS domain S-box protein [Spirochaetota bacterium]HQF07065.1 PAS domain S-box protein [Spirochaetota bacterium]HQH95802.1 PAS domain S-box protein [Spirochaetota bacterium]HQJ71682.1 PAS domain S-box protein [Spirochaetota bacterium]HRS78220.1 PAS domain S-box protein [Spirochaetota bacterium]
MKDVKVFIVEDELVTAEMIRDVLTGRGYHIAGSAAEGGDALDLIERGKPDIVLMDINIKGKIDGIGLANIVNERYRIPVIYLTAFADRETVERAKMTESYGYLIKPFSELELVTNIEIALYKHSFDRKLKDSELRYRTLFETMRDAVYMHDMAGKIIDFNPALEKMLGYSREEVFSISPRDVFVAGDDPDRFLVEIKKSGFIKDFSTRLRRKDGSVIHCLITANLERNPVDDGKVIRGVIRDITETEKTRQALQEQRDFIDAVLNSLPTVFYAINRDGQFVRWNRKLEELYGFSVDQMVGVNVLDVMDEKNRDIFSRMLEEGFSKGYVNFEARLRQASSGGDLRDYFITGRRVSINGAEYLVGSGLDITERKKTEEALRESELRYRAIFDCSLNLVYLHDLEGRFIDANDAALSLLGYERSDIPALTIADLVAGDDLEKAAGQIKSMVETGGQDRVVEYSVKTKSGSCRSIEASTSLLYHEGAPVAILGVARDITEQKRFIEEINYAYTENKYILNSITSILIGVSTNDTITHWNNEAERVFGITAPEALGKNINGFDINWDWPGIYTGISTCIINREPVNLLDITFTDKKGRKGLLGITINPIIGDGGMLRGFLVHGKDITDRRMVEQQLLQSSKMATVGEMATGVAHELNQPLNIIKMASQFMLDGINEKYATAEFIRERTEKIVAQVDRAAHIINHLREFGRKSDYDFAVIDPNMPVRVAFDMLGEQLRLHNINAVLDLDDTVPRVNGDLHKLEQVFINLIVNAKDAIESVKNPLQENTVVVRSFLDGRANAVVIKFSDSGPGIPDDIRDRIFEPFFTTKEVGKGTGLGLSISYGIIKAHHGSIDVASDASGTTFTITLPAAGGRSGHA